MSTDSDATTDTPPGIDAENATAWLAERVEGLATPLHFHKIAGGHSCLTYTVTAADGRKFVLRRPPLGHLLASAHDVIREARLITALAGTDVPVAPVVGTETDHAVIGSNFYVMDFVEGVVLHDRAASETLSVEARKRAGESMIEVMAALHTVDIDAVGLGDLAKRGDYLGRQLKRWNAQWHEADTKPMPGMDTLHDWLVANKPEEGPAGIVHGDFRLGNALHAPDGTVVALLDWELCTLGPGLADLSYLLRAWTSPSTSGNVGGFGASSPEGFSTREDLAALYEKLTGTDVGGLDYWMAFHAWRSAAIVAGVFTRYKHGGQGEPVAYESIKHFEDACEMGMNDGLKAAGIA